MTINTRRGQSLAILSMLALILTLTYVSAGKIQDKELLSDARQNAITSFYLWTAGRFSMGGGSPTYAREPLPIAVTALHMAWFTGIPKSVTIQALTTDPGYTRQLCQVNLWYLVGLYFTLWWLTWRMTRSHWFAAFVIVGTWWFFCHQDTSHLGLYTEIAAGLVVALGAATSVWMVQTRRLLAAILTGVAFGATALTKAAGFYVALAVIPVLAVALMAFEPRRWRQAGALFLAMALAFAVVVTPWMARNYFHFGEFAIAERSGIVLLTRAIKDRMTAEEYRAAFYVYAPYVLRQRLFESYFGFQPADLQPGGRWVRLIRMQPGDEEAINAGNVEAATSYFAKAWAMGSRWRKEMSSQGVPAHLLDQKALQTAVEMIRAEPGQHLLATLPFAWRGLWAFHPGNAPVAVLANLIAFAVFLAFPFIALWRRRLDWLAFSLFGWGLFWFYAVLTHFIPRYSAPLVPLTILSVMVLAQDFYVRKIKGKWRSQ